MNFIICNVAVLLQSCLFFLAFQASSADYVCNDSSSCVGLEIAVTNGAIICYGYKSCATGSTISNSNGEIECHGAFSCYEATSIIQESLIYSDGTIKCNGLYSCAFINETRNDIGGINCFGEKSCYSSNIYFGLQTLDCAGSESCANSIIVINNEVTVGISMQVKLSGHASGRNSIFYVKNAQMDVTFYVSGTDSGQNASIVCGDGVTCVIECDGNGCNDLNLECSFDSNTGGASNCILDVNCDYAEMSSVCPSGYNISVQNENYQLPNLLEDGEYSIITSNIDNSLNLCDSSDVTNCDGYKSCYQSEELIRMNGSGICCTAYQSCSDARSIETRSEDDSNSSMAIRCDSVYSCNLIDGIYDIGTINGGNIYFSGYNAGYSSKIKKGGKNTDIFVSGSEGMYYTEIENVDNVYCLSYQACYESTISNVTNVWTYGQYGNAFSDILNIENNVYCAAELACFQTAISNVGNDIYGIGRRALASSVITSVNNVYCFSTDCGYASQFTNIVRLNAVGNNSLSAASIASELSLNGRDSNTFTMEIYGNNDGDYFTVYCTELDTCNIDCQSGNACLKMKLYCYGNSSCNVICGTISGYTFACPIQEYGSYSIVSAFATSAPTNTPTEITSDLMSPTSFATVESDATTNAPTLLPSGVATTGTAPVGSVTSASTSAAAAATSTPSVNPTRVSSSSDIISTNMSVSTSLEPEKTESENSNNNNNSNDNNNNSGDDSEEWMIMAAVISGTVVLFILVFGIVIRYICLRNMKKTLKNVGYNNTCSDSDTYNGTTNDNKNSKKLETSTATNNDQIDKDKAFGAMTSVNGENNNIICQQQLNDFEGNESDIDMHDGLDGLAVTSEGACDNEDADSVDADAISNYSSKRHRSTNDYQYNNASYDDKNNLNDISASTELAVNAYVTGSQNENNLNQQNMEHIAVEDAIMDDIVGHMQTHH